MLGPRSGGAEDEDVVVVVGFLQPIFKFSPENETESDMFSLESSGGSCCIRGLCKRGLVLFQPRNRPVAIPRRRLARLHSQPGGSQCKSDSKNESSEHRDFKIFACRRCSRARWTSWDIWAVRASRHLVRCGNPQQRERSCPTNELRQQKMPEIHQGRVVIVTTLLVLDQKLRCRSIAAQVPFKKLLQNHKNIIFYETLL